MLQVHGFTDHPTQGLIFLEKYTVSKNTSSTNKDYTEAPPSTIEFIDGELFVFGKQIRAHSEMPWLFCATDLHKACEFFIKRAAVNKGKDPDTKFSSLRPSNWINRNLVDEDTISEIADITRQRIRERGAYLGIKATSKKSNATAVALLDTLSDKEMILYSRKGNSPTSGTYLSLHALVQYASFMNKSLHTKIIQCYMDVITGDVDRVTEAVVSASVRAKGTATRAENKQLTYELSEECARKKLLPIKPQQGINEGILGMTATKYKKYFGVAEPLNDNLSVDQVSAKNMAMIMATDAIRRYAKPVVSQKDGVTIGRVAALQARAIRSDRLSHVLEAEVQRIMEQDKINEKRIAKDFRAGKRPSLPN